MRRRRQVRWSAVGAGVCLAALLAAALTGCSDDGGDADDAGDTEQADADRGDGGGEVAEPELAQELVDMQAADQADRTGDPSGAWDDEARTERLDEIIEEHGWPTRDLVGDEGATAAWVIAQHSDLDVEFQQRALELMREAVEDDQADASELAYLEDRVAANSGEPQTYGTQIGCVDGQAQVGELADPERVDELRAEVGLVPLDDYLAELEPSCAAEAEAAESGGTGTG